MRLSRTSLKLLPPLALAGVALAAGASPASAAKVLPSDIDEAPRAGKVELGEVTLKLSDGAARRLSSAGGRLSGSGDLKVTGRTIKADTGSGSVIDPTTMRGTLVLSGSLTARGRSRSAKLTRVTLEPGIERRVTARVGGRTTTLGSLKGGKVTFSGLSDGDLKGATLALSSSGAKRLNAATGGGFASGSFAKVDASIQNAEIPLKDGTATVTIDPTLLQTLTNAGYAITAEAPATYASGVVTLPLTGGAFDPEGATGRLALEGKLLIGNGTVSVPLYGWRAAIGGGQRDLYAKFNAGSSSSAALASVDTSKLVSTFAGAGFSATGGRLTLSKPATDILRQTFNVTFAPGTAMATVDIQGALSGRQ